ncbi:hypothetical protein BKA01_000478 [Pseudonocardia eucalypti]|nr:hypothetical protein [Pseudonocardia eucalypti]
MASRSSAHTRRPTDAETSTTSTVDPVATSTEYGRADHHSSIFPRSWVA